MHINRKKKAFLIKAIVDEHYQPNSHKGSLRDIWRNHVVKVYPMSEVTFYRYIEYAIRCDGYVGNGSNRVQVSKHQEEDVDNRYEQLELF